MQSLLPTFPSEILQDVFFFAVFQLKFMEGRWGLLPRSGEREVRHSSADLQAICSVSRRWRDAAIGHPILWTVLPDVSLSMNEDSNARIVNTLRVFLVRSGNLPVTFKDISLRAKVWSNHRDGETFRGCVRAVLDLLAEHSFHLGNLEFRDLPCEALQYFSSVCGQLPLLHTVRIQLKPTSIPWRGFSGSDTIDFKTKGATSLRTIEIALPTQEAVRVSMPFSRVVTAKIECDARFDSMYREILEANPRDLEALECGAYVASTQFPQTPCTLPSLKELRLLMGPQLSRLPGLIAHLDQLTLPSLRKLQFISNELPLSLVPHQTVPETILSLIQRSKCSFEELIFPSMLRDIADPETNPIFDAFALSPTLRKLVLPHVSGPGLRRLVLDPRSPAPMLPQLDTLSIFCNMQNEGRDLMDVGALMDMVYSRTILVDEANETDDHVHSMQPLTRLYVRGYEIQSFHKDLIEWEMANLGRYFTDGLPAPDTAGEEVVALVHGAEVSLEAFRNVDGLHLSMYPGAYGSLMAAIRSLEAIDLGRVNSSILVWRNVPCRLQELTLKDQAETQDMSGGLNYYTVSMPPRVYVGQQAERLLEKWKPYLLRDARASPFLWNYLRSNPFSYARMRYVRSMSDEDLWSKILEPVDEHSELRHW